MPTLFFLEEKRGTTLILSNNLDSNTDKYEKNL